MKSFNLAVIVCTSYSVLQVVQVCEAFSVIRPSQYNNQQQLQGNRRLHNSYQITKLFVSTELDNEKDTLSKANDDILNSKIKN